MQQSSGFEVRVLAAFGLAAALILALTGLTWRIAQDASEVETRVRHTQEMLGDLLRVRATTVEIELAAQSYRSSGDPAHLALRDRLGVERERLLAGLQPQIDARPALQPAWQALRGLIAQRREIAREAERLRQQQGRAAADAYVAQAPLQATRDRTQALLAELEGQESAALQGLISTRKEVRRHMVLAGAATSALMLALLGLTWGLIRRRVSDSARHLRRVIDSVPVLIAFVDREQRYVYANAPYLARFAPGVGDITGRTVREVLGEARYAVAGPLIARALAGQPQSYDWQPFEGVWQAISYVPELDAQGRTGGYFVLGSDITERRRTEQALRASEQRLARVLEGAEEGYWDWDLASGRFEVSDRWKAMLGYAPDELEVQPAVWPSLVHPEDLPVALASIERHLAGHSPAHHAEIRCRTKSGEWRWLLTRGRVVQRDAEGRPLVMSGTHTDISLIKSHQAELARVANFDPLTGLPNRRLLTDRLQQSLLRSQRSGQVCAVCLLDLDGFKAVNDRHGHAIGDQVLVALAARLKATLRAQDTLARLGGDEFVLLLCELEAAEDSPQILDRVLQALARPLQVDGLQLDCPASIGVSLYPADDADADTLLRHAEQAMVLAKQAGKGRYQLFDLAIDRQAQARRAQLVRLGEALAGGEFVLHYQPKVDLGDGRVNGVEALIRWQHPELGLLPPGHFLPAVAGSDLEQPLGNWVIEEGLRQIGRWAAAGLALPVSVNVSAVHLLRPDFVERLRLALAAHPAVPPGHLTLEVLESAALEDMAQAVEIMLGCMALGVRFALDDFGTGYSSLSYLRELPVHTLKIDQRFVRGMLDDAEDLAIVRSVIDLAATFGRQVIAEGVETLEHGQALRELGCRQAQGWGIARAMPADELPAWCQAWTRQRLWQTLDSRAAPLPPPLSLALP